MSRWVMPRACAAASADATWRPMAAARATSKAPSSRIDLAQVPPLDVLHDDEGPAVLGDVEVVHAHRVGMLQPPRDHRFVAEALQEPLVVAELRGHDLHGADLPEGEMAHAVDGGHPARADLLEDLVFAAHDHARDEVGGGAQGRLVRGTGAEVVGVRGAAGVAVLHAPPVGAHCSTPHPAVDLVSSGNPVRWPGTVPYAGAVSRARRP